jgi:hypothetical protein
MFVGRAPELADRHSWLAVGERQALTTRAHPLWTALDSRVPATPDVDGPLGEERAREYYWPSHARDLQNPGAATADLPGLGRPHRFGCL